MFQKSLTIALVLFAIILFATENSFAQTTPGSGPCLLGVGVNCPTDQSNNSDRGRGTRYYDGRIAQEILRAHNYGSRYLVVLNRYFDHTLNCNVEERAWVGTIVANGDGRVAVQVGPSFKVSLCNSSYSAEQVNNMEAWMQYSRNQIYAWLKYKEQVAPYLNNPSYQAWARQELGRADAAIYQHEQYIKQAQAAVATSAPQ